MLLFNPPPEPSIVEEEEPPVSEEPVIAKAEEVISFAAAKFGPPPHANNTILCNRYESQGDCEGYDECEWKEFPNKNDKSKGKRPNADGMCKKKSSNSRRLDADERVISTSGDLEGDLDHDVCDRVLQPRMYGNSAEEIEICEKYEFSPLVVPDCSERAEIVPRILHSVSRDAHQSYHQSATSMANPSFQRNHHSDATALEYVRSKCGEEAAMAYSCFIPPAYRADLFRFCAMYADGGIYLDAVSDFCYIYCLIIADKFFSQPTISVLMHAFYLHFEHHPGYRASCSDRSYVLRLLHSNCWPRFPTRSQGRWHDGRQADENYCISPWSPHLQMRPR